MIKWGILGTGHMASTFTVALKNSPGCKVSAVGSRSATQAEKFAKQFDIETACSSYNQLMESDVDVIYIASTNNLHFENTMAALNAGKHVLVEKPFALNTDQANQMLTLAKQKGLFCMEGMWMRFIPMIREAISFVNKGELGTIKMITANFGMPFTFSENNRQFDPALGGGALLDLLVYPLSFTNALLGIPKTIQSQSTLSSTGVDEQTAVMLTYENGVIANLQASFVSELANEIYIYGDKGSIHINAPMYRPHESNIKYYQPFTPGAQAVSSGGGLKSKIKNNPLTRSLLFKVGGIAKSILKKKWIVPFEGSGYEHEIADVIACINNKKTESDIMTHEDTINTMKIMDEIRTQQNIQFPTIA